MGYYKFSNGLVINKEFNCPSDNLISRKSGEVMSMFENHKTIAYKEFREFVNESVLELIKKTKDKKCNGCIDFVFDEETSTGHCEALETTWPVKNPDAVQRLTDCYICDLKAMK